MGLNQMPLHDLWIENWDLPICNSTMSRNTEKFALFSTVWNRFIENCFVCYKPGPYVTIDEQLFPSKAKCSFT